MSSGRTLRQGPAVRRLLAAATVAAAALLLALPASANPPSALEGYKSASVSWKRVWDWTIEKRVTPTTGTICAPEESGQVRTLAGDPPPCSSTSTHNYTIELTRTKRDSYTARGQVCVRNVGAGPTKGLRIEDQIQLVYGSSYVPLASRSLDLSDNPVLDPGELACYAYSIPFSGVKKGATLRNVAFIAADNAPLRRPISPPYGLPSWGAYSVVAVAPMRIPWSPSSELNKRVDVIDSALSGPLSFPRDGGSLSYEYKKTYDECRTFPNTASLYDGKGQLIDYAEASVTITCEGDPPPPPPNGCTYTQGYWKTHSDRGPAPYDDAWKNLGTLEEDTLFFNSGDTWYEVFGTPPQGNGYYILAHQYMAAKLNVLNGAAPTAAVSAAISAAEALFNAQGSGDTTLTAAERANAIAWAETLDDFNNGRIGPGHC